MIAAVALFSAGGHTLPARTHHGSAMRIVFALLLLPVLAIGCTPHIPVKGDFGASALAPSGDTAPEFAQFNAYDPAIGALVANQICVTPYTGLDEKNLAASPGRIVQTRARCQTHTPFIGDGDFVPDLIQ